MILQVLLKMQTSKLLSCDQTNTPKHTYLKRQTSPGDLDLDWFTFSSHNCKNRFNNSWLLLKRLKQKSPFFFALNDVKHLYLDLLFHCDHFFPVYHGMHHYNFQAGSHISWICFFGDCLRIVPFDSSPFCNTIWERMFTFSEHLKQTQVDGIQERWAIWGNFGAFPLSNYNYQAGPYP